MTRAGLGMANNKMEKAEAARTSYRPERITTLFVGESAPDSEDFFYYGERGGATVRKVQQI
jgi:hypothetical protein